MITRVKLEAFMAAARELGVAAINFIAGDTERLGDIVSIDAGSREDTEQVAAALDMPAPALVVYNGRRWLSSTVAGLSVRSTPEDVAIEQPAHLAAGGAS